MEGDLSLVSVPDLLQMICLGGYSRDIHLFDGSTQLGVIAIRNGRVDRCFGFGTWGEAAFYKLVHLRRGSYKVNEAQDMSASDAALTAYSWQELLMEAARRQDEAEYIAQSAAATGRVIAFPTPASHAAAHGPPARPTPFPALFDPIPTPPIPAPPSTGTPTPSTAMTAVPSSGPITISTGVVTEPANERASAGLSAPHPDIAALLAEATTHYLRRDLARAEEILQQCLALRPGDRRVLQNLERIRRKKSQ
ncbi:MAG TPA: DUF4388 domain-containing protein [Kofleriaceae bacterium]|jgi:hypothetical protein|nr:DUF4388 domain-containing protein [Kofleriaceae bacterium]